MTTYGVLGETAASSKLITATLNDLMEAHHELTPDDEFWFIIGMGKKPTPALDAVMDWCIASGTYYEVYTSTQAKFAGFDHAGEIIDTEDPYHETVEALYSRGDGHRQLLALVGPEDPPADVARAIARATDSLIEVRDLTEGALTYIKFYGDAVDDVHQQEEKHVPAEEENEVTLDELPGLGTEADDYGDDSTAAITLGGLAVEFDLDVNDFGTWEEVAAAIYEAADDGEEEESEEDEEEESEEDGEWTAEALKGLKLTEVRAHGKAAGIPGADKMKREDLVKALIDGVVPDDDDEPAPAKKAPGKKEAPAAFSTEELVHALKVLRDYLSS